MGYWPRKMKVRRSNWVTNLERKLVLVGCTGHHEFIIYHGDIATWPARQRKLYVLNAPGYEGERAWAGTYAQTVQVKAFSDASAVIKGAKMMELL